MWHTNPEKHNTMETAQKIQTAIISALVNEGGSATFATIQAVVEADQFKTNKDTGEVNPFWKSEIRKRVVLNVLLNGNYSRMVNTKREKEGKTADFKAKKAWFIKVFDCDNGNIVCHRADANITEKDGKDVFASFNCETPRLYVFVACNTAVEPKTLDYFIDGRIATKKETAIIKAFTPVKTANVSQGLEAGNEVIPRTITLNNFAEHKGVEEVRANKYQMAFEPIL